MSKVLQLDLLDSESTRKKKVADHDSQLLLLPVDPMQEKYNQDRIVLSDREFEILHLVLSGHSILEIAAKIFLSIAGIKFRLSSIYWKFDVKNRLELIKKSANEGLQFYSTNHIKHIFHNRLNMRDFKEDTNEHNANK